MCKKERSFFAETKPPQMVTEPEWFAYAKGEKGGERGGKTFVPGCPDSGQKEPGKIGRNL